jgi:hypothetical protein
VFSAVSAIQAMVNNKIRQQETNKLIKAKSWIWIYSMAENRLPGRTPATSVDPCQIPMLRKVVGRSLFFDIAINME